MRRQDWGSREAAGLLEKVIAADPQSAYAYAHLADWHAYSILAHGVGHEEARSKTLALAKKAIQLDPNDSTILSVVANAYSITGELEVARNCLEKAIKHNPNSYIVMSFAGLIFAYLGDIDEALRWNEKILRYDPVSIEAYREASLEINYLAGRYNDAIRCFIGWDSPPSHSLAVAAAAYAQAGRNTESVKLREEHAARVSSGCSFAQQLSAQMRMCAHQKQRDLWLEGYRKAGFDC
jgi:tetratricopeptide (TPR) repeat protein